MKSKDQTFKVAIVGGEGTGKTSLIKSILKQSVDLCEEPSSVVNHYDLQVKLTKLDKENKRKAPRRGSLPPDQVEHLANPDDIVDLELWDIPGQARF